MKTAVTSNKKSTAKPGRFKLVPIPDEADIVKCLSRVKEVDAIFVANGDLCSVWSVIPNIDDKTMSKVIRAEERLHKLYPDAAWDFHMRVHQGRDPSTAGPYWAKMVFRRAP